MNFRILVLSSLLAMGCSGGGFSVGQLRSTPDPSDKISLTVSNIESSESSTNTVQNNVTFQDAKMLMKEFHLNLYDSGKVEVTGFFESLTPTTVKDLTLTSVDFGSINDAAKFTRFPQQGNEQTILSKTIVFEGVTLDSEIRQIEVSVRFLYDYSQQKYTQIVIISHMVDSVNVGTNNTGNETYGVILH